MSETTAVQIRKTQLTNIKAAMEKALPQIQQSLARVGITPDYLMRTAYMAVVDTPSLHSTDPKTLVKCVIQAAQLGLSLDKNLGHAYLVPFEGKVQLMPGYRGLITLMDRSDRVRDVVTELVYDGDLFEYEIGMNADVLRWKPLVTPKERLDSRVTHAFSIVRLTNGGVRHRVLDIEDLLETRSRSASFTKNPKNSPWTNDFGEMCRKTAIRRVSKLVSLSPQLMRALSLDDDLEAGRDQDLGDVFPGELETRLTDAAQDGKKTTVEVLRERVIPKPAPAEPIAEPEGLAEHSEPVNTKAPQDAIIDAEVVPAAPKPEAAPGPAAEPQKPRRGRPPGSKNAAAGLREVAQSRPVDKAPDMTPPKKRLFDTLGGDASKLSKLSEQALGYERDSFDDVFEREAVAILRFLNEQK